MGSRPHGKRVSARLATSIPRSTDVMLVLSRKVGESFVIGDDITITVVRIAGGGVRIGVEAPSDCSVVRSELQDLLGGAAEELQNNKLADQEWAGEHGFDGQ